MSALRSASLSEPGLDHPLLNGLSRQRLEALIGPVHPRLVPAGRVLQGPAGGATEMHLLFSGLLRTYELTPDGREALVELIGPGGADGFVATAVRRARFIQTLEDSVILSLTEEHIDALVTEPVVASRLTRLLLDILRYREEQLRLSAVREPVRRVALMLLMLSDRFGRRVQSEILIECRLTHQALADMVGFRRETVTHALTRLTRFGAVRALSGRLVVDRQSLRRLASRPAPLEPGAADSTDQARAHIYKVSPNSAAASADHHVGNEAGDQSQ